MPTELATRKAIDDLIYMFAKRGKLTEAEKHWTKYKMMEILVEQYMKEPSIEVIYFKLV